MNIIDTHIHLYADDFAHDLPQLIEEAQKRGITRFFLPAIDSKYSDAMDRLALTYPTCVRLMAGLHPTHVDANFEQELVHVKKRIESIRPVAVGEIGIDLYWDTSYKSEQIAAFETQIQWANDFDLPIVIHCRDAFDEIFNSLDRMKTLGTHIRGILHCFTGNLEQAHRAIDLGLHLGIGGVATFKNGKIDQFLNQIDLRHIVLETDAPYLAPVPHRGKRNEPAFLALVAERVAEIYGVSLSRIAEVTSVNALRIFGT